jgi:hypothetical protein
MPGAACTAPGMRKPTSKSACITCEPATHTRTSANCRANVVLEIRGNPVPGVGYATSYTDVSAYKRVEEKLRALAESLERRVLERTADLQRAVAEADRANRSKSKFLAAAVHDLSQPINAARLYVSAIKDRICKISPVADLAEHAERSLASVEALLASLMDISRLESGKLKLKFEDMSLRPLLESLAREFGMLAQSHGLELRCVASSGVVRSDAALLRRVLQNFLSNAVRYTSSGRILLGARRMRTLPCRIEVWDSRGVASPPTRLKKSFEEFRRLDAPSRAWHRARRRSWARHRQDHRQTAELRGQSALLGRSWQRVLDRSTAVAKSTMLHEADPLGSDRGRRGWMDARSGALTMTAMCCEATRIGAGPLGLSGDALRQWRGVPAQRKLHGRSPDLLILDYRSRATRVGPGSAA